MSNLVSVVIGVDEKVKIENIAAILSKDYEADVCDIDQNIHCIFAGIKSNFLKKIKEIEGILAIVKEENQITSIG